MLDREKVIGHLYDCLLASRLENMWVFVRKDIVGDALALLKEQEAVVRCGDCKNLGYTNSHFFCKWLNRCVDEDWFCADGERK